MPRASCALSEAGVLSCRWTRGGAPRPVASDVRAFAVRLGGGAYVLRRDGTLERYDRRGSITGAVATRYVSITGAGPFACGLDAGGRVACFRDRHEDLACRDASFAPVAHAIDVPRASAIAGAHAERADLITTDARGASGRWTLAASCEHHCLRLECGGPMRCVDPCPPGTAPALLARRAPEAATFFQPPTPVR